MATTAHPSTTARATRRRRRPSVWHLVLIPIAALFLIPFVQMALASLSPAKELIGFPPPFIPSHLTLEGFERLFDQTDILRWLLNTAIVAAWTIVSNLVLCSLAGYGFARLRFAGRNVTFLFVLATVMIPIQLLMIPTYILFAKVGLLNALAAAIVPWLATSFGVFLMRQFFLSLPAELEEAGRLDGGNPWQIFLFIVLPLARPALATLAIFTLLGSWNDLVWPLIAINAPESFTLQLGIANFQSAHATDWSLIMAGNVVATLPLILFFVVAQRHFIATMTFSGLKG